MGDCKAGDAGEDFYTCSAESNVQKSGKLIRCKGDVCRHTTGVGGPSAKIQGKLVIGYEWQCSEKTIKFQVMRILSLI